MDAQTKASRLVRLNEWGPRRSPKHVALTNQGVLPIDLEDRFTEQILDLHLDAAIVAVLSNSDGALPQFEGTWIEGHQLATSRVELLSSCLRWAER